MRHVYAHLEILSFIHISISHSLSSSSSYPVPILISTWHSFPFGSMTKKKKKSVATRLDEVDRTMHSSFCSAANSLSHLYTNSIAQQKHSFQTGHRHALEKVHQWIMSQLEAGSRVTTTDIVAHLQNELEYETEESPLSPRQPFHQQHCHSHTAMHSNLSAPIPSNVGQRINIGQPDQQTRNSVFSDALSSPICHSFQPYHLAQGEGSNLSCNTMSSGNGNRNCEMTYPNNQISDINSSNSGNCMGMHDACREQ